MYLECNCRECSVFACIKYWLHFILKPLAKCLSPTALMRSDRPKQYAQYADKSFTAKLFFVGLKAPLKMILLDKYDPALLCNITHSKSDLNPHFQDVTKLEASNPTLF